MSYVARKWFSGKDTSDPNTRYNPKDLGTWNTTSDVDNFCNTYNHDNNYTGIGLGDYVTINDGTYNLQWEIAGFDMEHNQLAADSTTYDNGYGICWIPKTRLPTFMPWNNTNTVDGGYKSSTIHNELNTTVANNLKTILGNHLINRNVLLSSATNGTSPNSNTSSAYTWTTAYCTLMSFGQMNGKFAQNNNKYDDGEANYKLPLFNYEDFRANTGWSRCVWGYSAPTSSYSAWCVTTIYPGVSYDRVHSTSHTVRQLIYLR